MIIDKDTAWFWINNLPGIGRKSISVLLDLFGSPEEIFLASDRVIDSIDFLKKDQKIVLKNHNIDDYLYKLYMYHEKCIQFIHYEDERYPKALKNIPDYPYCFYVKCEDDKAYDMFEKSCVSIVGSRNCSDYGYAVAYNMAKELVSYGVSIISGMAKGIDGAAHRGAVEFGGRTCAVLGCGVDVCYPQSNIELYMQVQSKGMIISEYPPGTKPIPGLFPERNRIISGLSDIVVVVEAGSRSGSLITIDMALEQGKDVYAVPGRLTDSGSVGCNRLIKNGAGIYTGVNDILSELGIDTSLDSVISDSNNNSLATEEKIVYARLGLEPKHVDSIVEETKLPTIIVLQVLMKLELRHMIRQTANNYYIINVTS